MARRRWNPSLHPRDSRGRFRDKDGSAIARSAVLFAPTAASAALNYKGIVKGAAILGAGHPVIGGALVAAGVLRVAKSTSMARRYYGARAAEKRGGKAAAEKFEKRNAQLDKGLMYASSAAGLAGSVGAALSYAWGPEIAKRAAKNRTAAATAARAIPKVGSSTQYAKKGMTGAYKVTTAGRKVVGRSTIRRSASFGARRVKW